MAKNKISEYSATSANNTDISNINIAEGCSPANVNNAIRTLMAQLKDQQDGTSGDNFTVGGNLTVTGTTTLTTVLPVASGGTGATTDTGARTALSAAKSGANSDITSITGLTTPLTTAQGGTGTASTTFANLATNVTGTLPVANGGTGATTLTSGSVIVGAGTSTPTFVAPTTTGNVLFTTNGTSWSSTPKITSGTVVSPMNTTNVTFSDIPAWVKKITLLVYNASDTFSFRLGTSGGIVSTGIYAYTAGGVLSGNQTSNSNTTTGTFFGTAENYGGTFTFHNITGNTWLYAGTAGGPAQGARSGVLSGYVTLPSGPLTQVQIVGTFTSGIANIMYE